MKRYSKKNIKKGRRVSVRAQRGGGPTGPQIVYINGSYSKTDALAKCAFYAPGSSLATSDQATTAWNNGQGWCSAGWLEDTGKGAKMTQIGMCNNNTTKESTVETNWTGTTKGGAICYMPEGITCGSSGMKCSGDTPYCLVTEKALPTNDLDQTIVFNTYGRYVKIFPPETAGDGWVYLGSLEIFDETGTNILKGKKVTSASHAAQPSTGYIPQDPTLVGDFGGMVRKYPNAFIPPTNNRNTVAWEVDLGQVYMITYIRYLGGDYSTDNITRNIGVRFRIYTSPTDTPTTGTCVATIPGARTGTSGTSGKTCEQEIVGTWAEDSNEITITSGRTPVVGETIFTTTPVPVNKEVFHVQGGYSRSEATAICSGYGATVATTDQLREAYEKGAGWCSNSWVTNSPQGIFGNPRQRGACNETIDTTLIYRGRETTTQPAVGATCYGIKPPRGSADVWPFNELDPNNYKWNQPTTLGAQKEVYLIGGGSISKAGAEARCNKYGAVLATEKQLDDARKAGAAWCWNGWLADISGGLLGYPRQLGTCPVAAGGTDIKTVTIWGSYVGVGFNPTCYSRNNPDLKPVVCTSTSVCSNLPIPNPTIKVYNANTMVYKEQTTYNDFKRTQYPDLPDIKYTYSVDAGGNSICNIRYFGLGFNYNPTEGVLVGKDNSKFVKYISLPTPVYIELVDQNDKLTNVNSACDNALLAHYNNSGKNENRKAECDLWGANCYGIKPAKGTANVLPFNNTTGKWYAPIDTVQ